MGYSSGDDRLELSDMLHQQGAWDDDETDDGDTDSDDDESSGDGLWGDDDDEHAWREEHADDFYVSVDPEDYETEEEYLEAVEDAGYDIED